MSSPISIRSARDFLKAARQRLNVAEFLWKNGYNLEAMYLGGYVIECALKSLVLEATPPVDRAAKLKEITSGKRMHNFEVLAGLLKNLRKPISLELARGLRRFGWSTDLRYQTGRINSQETRGFLKVAKQTYTWVEGQIS